LFHHALRWQLYRPRAPYFGSGTAAFVGGATRLFLTVTLGQPSKSPIFRRVSKREYRVNRHADATARY